MTQRKKKKVEWATVPVGEYTVPLIGIPKSATQEQCSRCGCPLHLAEAVLDDKGHPCCRSCIQGKSENPQR